MKMQNPRIHGSKGMKGLKSVTYGQLDGQVQSNMPSQHLQSWGHNKPGGLGGDAI